MAILTKSIGTVTLTGAVEQVNLPAQYDWVWFKNMSDGDVLAGNSADISDGADGVIRIPSGEAARVQADGRLVYLSGTGAVQVVCQNFADCPFKAAGRGGDADLSVYALKSDIPEKLPADGGNADTVNGCTVESNVPSNAKFTDTVIAGENLLINPNFRPYQMGEAGKEMLSSGDDCTFFVDRWRLHHGSTVTINADGTLALNGTISQVLESSVGTDVTASSDGGIARYDDSTKTFTITTNGAAETIRWAKLEIGSTATPFVPPDSAVELLKCQRYYYRLTNQSTTVRALVGFGRAISAAYMEVMFTLPTCMRAAPDITASVDDISYTADLQANAVGAASISRNGCPKPHSNVVIRLGGTFQVGNSYMIYLEPNRYIEFSAEL